MKAYCINLDRRPDRLEHMLGEAGRAGFAFQRVAAVDGSDPAVIARAREDGERSGIGVIGPGAYGCFQSHRKVWQRLLASGERWAMVLEDDMRLAPDFGRYLEEGWIPADADLVRLETFGTRVHLDKGPGREAGPRRLHVMRSTHLGCGAYVVGASAAATLLEASETIRVPADWVLFGVGTPAHPALRVYQMVESPAIQGKRAGGAAGDAAWSATSIEQRRGDGPDDLARETRLQRLGRRAREELRALAGGTRYRTVGFG